MKKGITFCLAALLLMLCVPLWGQTQSVASMDFSQQGYTNAQDLDGVTIEIDANVSIVFNKASGSTTPKYYTSGTAIRAYAGNTITVSALSGSITAIAFTPGASDGSNEVTSDVGTCEYPIWSGSTDVVTFSLGGTSGNRRIRAVEVTYESNSNVVSAPVLSPAAGAVYSNSVTVTATCATEGATICYTTNGDTPTEASMVFPTEGLIITVNTTVKARAFKADMTESAVVTAAYTFPEMYENIAAWKEAHPENNTTVSGISGDLTAVFQKDNYLYLEDATGGLLVFGSMTNTYENGDVISGGIYGTSSLYNGLIEFVPTHPFPEGVAGTPVEPVVATVAQLTSNFADYASKLVMIEGITFDENHTFNTSNATGRTTTFTQDGNTMTLYDNFKVLADYAVTAGEEADLVGFIGCHGETIQISPRSVDDIITGTVPVLTVATPVISPEGGQYVNSVEVTITCATEGAVIYYTTDETDPTASSTVYNGPLQITENVTLKAIAMKEGYENSEIASASYIIFTPVPVTFNKVVNPIDINTTDSYLLVCESASTAATSTIANSALQAVDVEYDAEANTVSTPIHGNGLPCQIYFETADNGYYIVINGKYLNNSSSTNLSLGNEANSVWVPNIYQGGIILENSSNSYRYIGGTTAEGTAYKAYSTKDHLGSDNYPFVVLYKDGETTPMLMVETPTITPNGGSYTEAQEVTLACATAGATIYYTLDGTDPTTESTVYTAPFTLSETTTVKAMAAAEGMYNSSIVSATFTFTTLMTIAEARALEDNEYALVQGVVTFMDGRNVYVQDATAGIVLYLNNNTVPAELALGDQVQAYGKKSVYHGLVELSGINGGDASVFSILSSGNEMPFAVKTIAEVLEDYNQGSNMLQSTRISIEQATVESIDNTGNSLISQNGSEINIYHMPVVEGLEVGNVITFVGVVGCHDAAQILIGSATDIAVQQPTTVVIPITLNLGWTWIPYVKDTPMSVEEAFSGITLTNGDIIKSQGGYSTYSESEGWVGSCRTLEPGKGYMFYNNGTEARTLIYP